MDHAERSGQTLRFGLLVLVPRLSLVVVATWEVVSAEVPVLQMELSPPCGKAANAWTQFELGSSMHFWFEVFCDFDFV